MDTNETSGSAASLTQASFLRRLAVAAHRAEYGSAETGTDGATADARDRVIAALDDVWTRHDLESGDIPSSAENADAVLATLRALAVEGNAR
jgi:monomeric isocitrate dehydrogenase